MPSVFARIFLLGRFAVEIEGRVVPAAAWSKRRPVDVLTALALAPGRALHREELIDRFWADKDLDAGANNLHRALHDLRRITRVELATLERGMARLAEDAWIDVEAFERAAADPASLASAVELYGGTLLPDDPYSDALGGRREALRQRFVDVALKLAVELHASGSVDPCVAVLRRALEVDPALEPAHRLLMEVLARMGRKGDALRQFNECVTALNARLEAVPSAATLELRAAIEREELAAAPSRASVTPSPPASGPPTAHARDLARRLVGRDTLPPVHGRADALAATESFLAQGRGVLLITGEAGLGKTRLAAECASRASSLGATVLAGIGLDLDSGIPYAPFVDAWADHRRRTRAPEAADPFLSFAPSGGSAQSDRLRLFQSIERSIESFGGLVCLVIEDLQEADPSSLHLFHHLARATRNLPLLLVGTLRDDEVRVGTPLHSLSGSLTRERLATRVALERLDAAAAELLVAELAGAASPELAARVYALAEGNPFFTEELVRAMREDEAAGLILPANLLDAVLVRVRRLGRDAERLFSAASLLGPSFSFEIARAAANLESDAALDALELAIDARLVVETGREYRFRHALVRQALLDSLTNARRVFLHRAIAEALEADGDRAAERHAEALAHHHLGAGQLARALPFLLSAANRAQARLGFTEAISFLERALELMDAMGEELGAERFSLLRQMGGMRMALSDLDGAVRDLDAAATLFIGGFRPPPVGIAAVRRIAALALIQAGRLAEAGQRLDGALEALATLDSSDDQGESANVLYLTAQLRWHEERYTEARELAGRSLAEAERRGNVAAMAKSREMMALACHSLGEWQEGRGHEAARQSLAGDGALDVDQAFDVHLCLWEYYLYGDQGLRAIRATVGQMLEQAERMKAPRAVALCKSFAGTLDFQSGDWSGAAAQLQQAVDLFRQVGSASGEALSLQRLGVLLTARGELERARAILDEGIAVGERAAMRSHCLTRLHASLARNRLAAGDRAGAQASLYEGLAESARHGRCQTCNSLLLPEAVRVELAWGNLAEAEKHATRLEEVGARYGSRAWTAMAEQARGRVLGARGQAEPAYQALERAKETFAAIGSPYEAARCALTQARALDPSAARTESLLERARDAFKRLGAVESDA
jgi:DNA-binding SARP family transcriptional activator